MELQVLVQKLESWSSLLEGLRQQLEQEEWNSLQQVPEAKECGLDPEELEETAQLLRRQRTRVLPKLQGSYQRSRHRLEGQLGVLYVEFLREFQQELDKLPSSELRDHLSEELRRDTLV